MKPVEHAGRKGGDRPAEIMKFAAHLVGSNWQGSMSRAVMRILWTLAAAVLCSISTVQTESCAAEHETARVIVKLKKIAGEDTGFAANSPRAKEAPTSSRRMAALEHRSGLELHQARTLSTRTHVVLATGLSSKALVERLNEDPDIEYVVVDARRTIQTTPNDPLYAPDSGAVPTGPASGQWYLHAPDSTTISAINAEPAWSITTGSSSGVIVAVLDTGVRYEHPDLLTTGASGKLLPGAALLSAQSIRVPDATDTGDWVTAGECGTGTTAKDSTWHGTQVSGLVGALSNNTVGMTGVAWNTRVLPVRVLAQCGGYDSDIIAAMNWVVGDAVAGLTQLPSNIANQVKVINLSLGSSGACNAAYVDAINNVRSHGVVVVAAAGNSDGQAVGAPANCPGVIAVGGLRHTGTKVGYSAVGTEISLSAPGGNCVNQTGACLYPLLSTSNAGLMTAAASIYTDEVKPSLGTSFSAPLVSGTAALMLGVRPALLPDDVRRLLRDYSRTFPAATGGVPTCHAPNSSVQSECNCTTSTCGAGMLDAGLAVAAATHNIVPRITVNPSEPHTGQTVTLDASSSLPSAGGTSITGYAWSLVDGGGIVTSVTGPLTGSQITVATSGSGRFTFALTVTDDSGGLYASTTTTETVTVSPLLVPVKANGGGGGASSIASALALALAVGALARLRRT